MDNSASPPPSLLIESSSPTGSPGSSSANNSSSFPAKLHRMLTDAEQQDGNDLEKVVSWAPHGRSFKVHDKKVFLAEIMPRYFYQLKYNSFQRQLNLYGFKKIQHQGKDKGSFYHEHFLRGMPGLTTKIRRTKGKGDTGRPRASEAEPDFYAMPPLPGSGGVNSGNSNKVRAPPPPAVNKKQDRKPGLKRAAPDSPFTKPNKDPKRSKKDAELAFNKSLQALMGQTAAQAPATSDRPKAVPGNSTLVREGLPSVLDFMMAGMDDCEPIHNSHDRERQHPSAVDAACAPLAHTTAFQPQDKASGSFSSSLPFSFDLEPTPIMPGMALPPRQQQQQQTWQLPSTNSNRQPPQMAAVPEEKTKAAARYPTPAAGLWYDEPVDEFTLELADISTDLVRASRSQAQKKKAPPPPPHQSLPTATPAASHECRDDCSCLQRLLSRSIDHPETLPQNGLFGFF